MKADSRIAEEIIRNRLSQMLINEMCKTKQFKIPIHLALGHEAIAVAVSAVMGQDDQLVLSHRNVHYNVARNGSLKSEIDEYLLSTEGLAAGRLGAMNLANKDGGIVYTSSILGNNLCVSAGLALGKSIKGEDGVVFVVTGDGAMEEGAFYESLQFLKTYSLPAIIVVENNGWSLATQVHERRCPIHVNAMAAAFAAHYRALEGNDPYVYAQELADARAYALQNGTPVIVEVKLTSLGYWHMKTPEYPEGKFINYHAGAAPEVAISEMALIREDQSDPVFVLLKYFPLDEIRTMVDAMMHKLRGEIL